VAQRVEEQHHDIPIINIPEYNPYIAEAVYLLAQDEVPEDNSMEHVMAYNINVPLRAPQSISIAVPNIETAPRHVELNLPGSSSRLYVLTSPTEREQFPDVVPTLSRRPSFYEQTLGDSDDEEPFDPAAALGGDTLLSPLPEGVEYPPESPYELETPTTLEMSRSLSGFLRFVPSAESVRSTSLAIPRQPPHEGDVGDDLSLD